MYKAGGIWVVWGWCRGFWGLVNCQVASSVDATTQQVLAALPPAVKDALVATGSAAAAVGGQVVSHPREAAVVVLAVGVPTAYRWARGIERHLNGRHCFPPAVGFAWLRCVWCSPGWESAPLVTHKKNIASGARQPSNCSA